MKIKLLRGLEAFDKKFFPKGVQPRTWPGPTFLGWINFLFLQWIGVRLGRVSKGDGTRRIGWAFTFPVLPLTCWWGRQIPARCTALAFLPESFNPADEKRDEA